MKGSVGVENVVILMWVIALASISTYVLWQLGFFTIEIWENKKAINPEMFKIEDWAVYENGTVKISLKNLNEFAINNFSIMINGNGASASLISAGRSQTFEINNATNVKDKYILDVEIKYNMNGRNFTTNGTLYGVVEK